MVQAFAALNESGARAALLERETAQLCHARLAPLANAVITLSCPGPAPLWPGDVPREPLAPHPTGNAIFNYPSSMLFAPAMTVPLLSVSCMPVGVQLMGQQHSDARSTALARWLLEFVAQYKRGRYFSMVLHPHIIGFGHRMRLLEAFFSHLQNFPGVWNPTAAQCAQYWQAHYPASTTLHLEPSIWQDYPGSLS